MAMMIKEEKDVTAASSSVAPATSAGRALSVRTKGALAFAALITYAIVIALFVFYEKHVLMGEFDQIEKSLEIENLLNQADSAAFHTMMAVFVNVDAQDKDEGMQRVRMHYQSLRTRYDEVRAHLPALDVSLERVGGALEAADADPSKERMNKVVAELVTIKNALNNLAESSRQERLRISEQYRAQTDSVTITAMFLAMLALTLLGVTIGLFFKQLSQDLVMLQNRARDIIAGYRGAPIPVRRQDEVGELMVAVNSMASALDKREKELLLERQKYFHQEKMAAIGALAAGVAHEIGNPIAAISGIAQDMAIRREEGLGTCASRDLCGQCRPDLILEQAQRLSAITREISDFSSPQPIDAQFVDLNALVRSTANLIRYDRRLQAVDLKLDLDTQLPAIYGMADQLMQLIMNLLINAIDALELLTDRSPNIVVATRIDGERVCMTVEDNGPGMEKEVLARAFDAFFTTKPAGKGTGLGLPLCYSIMKRHEGTIEIDSTPGAGTRVQAFFPIKEIC